jgi:hypothetical protein
LVANDFMSISKLLAASVAVTANAAAFLISHMLAIAV